MSAAENAIRILVVDDLAVERELLTYLLEAGTGMQVVGTAADGEAAVAEVARLKPDVVAMDINMPRLNGIEATRRIMETTPTPIVIVSGSNIRAEVAYSFQAIEAGALAIVEKPTGIEGEQVRQLVDTVRLMSEVKVVRRWPPRPVRASGPGVVVIGASTGGPLALRTILTGLSRDFPVPIAIVQHMTPRFTEGFGDWLREASGFTVEIAVHGAELLPGHAYLAPDRSHLLVERDKGGSGRIHLAAGPPENGYLPAIAALFRSAAQSFGSGAVGVLLTGMGRDGAEELKQLHDRGALTIVQSPGSAVVAGMPGEAIALGAATHVLPLHRIAAMLEEICHPRLAA